MKVKSKIRIGLLFLLFIIILLAASGSYYINMLADESRDILKDNYNTLQYTKNMIDALDETDRQSAFNKFETNLIKQESNITEKGEEEATKLLRHVYEEYKGSGDSNAAAKLRGTILRVQELNMKAIVTKNNEITEKTRRAFAYISILGTFCFLLSFTFVINFPRWVANPITDFTEAIKGILRKDYSTRIMINSKDEFGDMAVAFNQMATQLDAWEHSNLAQVLFEKSRIETIINNMQDAVIGLDEGKTILFVNPLAENLLAKKEDELKGKYAPDVA
ncbi:MAG: HAMP domain-containing protein, partial [Bacteroidetes bacterium]|nr:HAMP domain-containing protein [Bacteroidota bacterium]